VVAITKPFGFYMTRVFVGEWTPLSPLLRPVERLVYRCCGVKESEEQSWRLYAISMVLFGATGFVTLYLWQRLQWYLPLNPQGQPGVEPVLAFNTAPSGGGNRHFVVFRAAPNACRIVFAMVVAPPCAGSNLSGLSGVSPAGTRELI
jgi:K+-transporting ATPase ATPase A chain